MINKTKTIQAFFLFLVYNKKEIIFYSYLNLNIVSFITIIYKFIIFTYSGFMEMFKIQYLILMT